MGEKVYGVGGDFPLLLHRNCQGSQRTFILDCVLLFLHLELPSEHFRILGSKTFLFPVLM